jgi:hypothetical protein
MRPLSLLATSLSGSFLSSLRHIGFAVGQEFTAATRLLTPLCTPFSPELRSAMGRIYLQAGLLDQALAEFNLVSESIANVPTPSISAVTSPDNSPNPSRFGSQVSITSGYQSQGSGGRGGNVTQKHKNLINMNAALMASAQGDWVRAEEILRGLVSIDQNDFVVSDSWFRSCSLPLVLHSKLFRLSILVSFPPRLVLAWE